MAGLTRSEIAISHPFTFTLGNGVKATKDQNKIWMDRAKVLLGTIVGERLMYPLYGTDVSSQVFGNETETQINIERGVYEAFAKFMPNITVQDVSTSFNAVEGSVEVNVSFQLPNQTVSSIVVGYASINGNQLILEKVV